MTKSKPGPIDTERENLYTELNNIATSHQRRLEIGERLAAVGDTRNGISVKGGLPDIAWLPVDGSQGRYRFEYGDLEVKSFFIAKYLITVTQYQAFVDNDYNDPRWWVGLPDEYRPQSMQSPHNNRANAPRDSLSWYQSIAFARWMTAKFDDVTLTHPSGFVLRVGDNAQIRLPTEWECQWAAQAGLQALEYPWGKWDKHPRANTTASNLDDRSTAVGMYPHGAAECGALDMAGNLWEWCLNDRQNPEIVNGYGNGAAKSMRGGSCANYYGRESAATSYRNQDLPQHTFYRFGMRLIVGSRL
ncbi:MAG: hypothetical protein OHK0046_38810 [Anaerolineae bacterium]